jgi:hypothetical protein
MSATTIIDNDYATLLYHPDKKIVHHTFHKPIGGEPFRQVLLAGLNTLKANGAQKWLSDDRANSVLPPEDAEWGTTVWFPQVKAAGWKYWALVVPNDVKGRINMAEFVESYFEQGIRIMVFTDPEEALKWLTNL